MVKRLSLLIIVILISLLFICNYAVAAEFGIISETLLYPDGLRPDIDSKLQLRSNIATSDDYTDKREGKRSLKGVVPSADAFGFGIIWDPDDNDIADPKDMALNVNGSLKFWVKTETPLRVGIKDSNNVEKWVDLSVAPFNIPSDNQWRFVSIPINSYFAGVDLFNVTELFMVAEASVPASANLTFHFDNVRWDTASIGSLNSIDVYPATWTVPTGLPKSFIARGYDSDGDEVDIYPNWAVSGLGGTFNSTEGPISIFTPNLTPGSGTVTATYGGFSDNAAISTEDITWNDFFNIFVDEGLYGSAGKYDSDDGNADGDGLENNSITVESKRLAGPVGTNNPPLAVSITPSNGSSATGAEVIVAADYSDTDGSGNITEAHFQIRSQEDNVLRIWAYYNTSTNLLYIKSIDGSTWEGGFAPESSNIIENLYASLNCANTVIENPSRETLRVSWAITFKSLASRKAHDLRILVKDSDNAETDWEKRGTWMVKDLPGVNTKPYVGVVSPTKADVFPAEEMLISVPYHDNDGWNDIKYVYLRIDTELNNKVRLLARYDKAAGLIELRDYNDTQWFGGSAPGSDNVIENYYAVLNCKNTTVTSAGDTLQFKWAVTFKTVASHKLHYAYFFIEDTQGAITEGWKLESNINVITENPQGTVASVMEATYSITDIGWAGFFFQEGELSDETSVKDVARFEEGYLYFRVKTTADIAVGLRSGNVAAGDQESEVMLSEYGIPADGQWQEVYIALDDFKIRDGRIDYSKMKVFLNVAVIGREIGASSGVFWISDVKYVARKTATHTLSIELRRRADNALEIFGEISWSTGSLNGSWELADQYLEIAYDSPNPSWGAQIYTYNMGTGASPKYVGKPKEYLDQQPAGLIGDIATEYTCSMAWMVLDGTNQNVPAPVESTVGGVGGFKSDSDGMWGGVKAESEWLWLKDVNSTKWFYDQNNNGIPDQGEIMDDFKQTGDPYSTMISPAGLSTGWGDIRNGTRTYILNPDTPAIVYLAADFKGAKVIQKYRTNTITIELYHY